MMEIEKLQYALGQTLAPDPVRERWDAVVVTIVRECWCCGGGVFGRIIETCC